MENLKNSLTFRDIITHGERLSPGYFILTPRTIASFSSDQRLAVVVSIGEIFLARYGHAHKDPTIHDPPRLEEQIARADLRPHKGERTMYIWLVGTDTTPGFVTAIVDFGNSGAKLSKSVKSPACEFDDLGGGRIMRERIPFILDHLPHVSYFSVDSRTANVKSVVASATSPLLVPCGLETKHYSLLDGDTRPVQDASVVMIGLRNPQAIPPTELYVHRGSRSLGLMQAVINLMHARWQISSYNLNSIPQESDFAVSEIDEAPPMLTSRRGGYTSVRLDNPGEVSRSGIENLLFEHQEAIFGAGLEQEGSRYFTFELNPADPTTLPWQETLEANGFTPTRFWPPTSPQSPPWLRYGKLHPNVSEVFEIDLPTRLPQYEHPTEISTVFDELRTIGKALYGERNIIPEAF